MAADVGGVESKTEEGEPVGDSSSEGRAEEAESDGIDEEVVEKCVEGGGEEKDVGARAHDFWVHIDRLVLGY